MNGQSETFSPIPTIATETHKYHEADQMRHNSDIKLDHNDVSLPGTPDLREHPQEDLRKRRPPDQQKPIRQARPDQVKALAKPGRPGITTTSSSTSSEQHGSSSSSGEDGSSGDDYTANSSSRSQSKQVSGQK